MTKKQLMVGQVGLEPTETEADGFTVRAATSYGILTHVLEIINMIFFADVFVFTLQGIRSHFLFLRKIVFLPISFESIEKILRVQIIIPQVLSAFVAESDMRNDCSVFALYWIRFFHFLLLR